MTPDELRDCLDILGWSQRQLSFETEVDEGTVRKWARGKNPIPESIANWIVKLSNFHIENPPPPPPARRAE
jgi:transcriptional regulator with XRE-family HTH domain